MVYATRITPPDGVGREQEDEEQMNVIRLELTERGSKNLR